MDPERAVLLNPRLSTERLVLEPLTGDHAPELFEPMQDPAIYEWISARPPWSVDALRHRWTQLETRISPDGDQAWLGWAVRRTTDQRCVGKVDAEVEGLEASNVGYLFFPPFWGQGYAGEAIRSVADHLVALGTTRLVATVTVGNHASGRVLEKAGFVRGRVIPEHDTIRGVKHDDWEYLRHAEPG